MQRSNGTENSEATDDNDPGFAASAPTVHAFDPLVIEVQHAPAVREIEDQRREHGHLTPGISAQVGASILTAGKCALAVTSTEDTPGAGLSTQFVVAARPGTGKASHAIALMMAVLPRC
jgi:hypothetical protein